MKNRILSLLLALCLLCTMVPMTVYAATTVASGKCGANLTWKLDGDGLLTIDGTGDMYNYTTVSDPAPWYSVCGRIGKVSIAEGVTGIGNYAFYGCTSLTSISLPDSLSSIGDGAFYSCRSLTSISLPDSLSSIGDWAFFSCTSLTSISLPDSLSSIGDWAFYYCDNLTSISLPDSLSSIGDGAFDTCLSLTSISLPEGLSSISDSAFAYCESLTSISLPDSLGSIGAWAFSFCYSLTSISLPDSLWSIGEGAFYYCDNLTSISLPDSLSSIGGRVFEDCDSLTSVTFEGKAPTIGTDAFENVTATCYYPANDPTWTSDVLQDYGGDLTWVPMSQQVEIVASGECGDDLTWTLSADGVLTVSGSGAMYDYSSSSNLAPWDAYRSTAIREVVIKPGVTHVGDWSFNQCYSLKKVSLPEGLKSIGNDAFYKCDALEEARLPESLQSIGRYAFGYCYKLKSIDIPGSVKRVEAFAFYYCDAAETLTLGEGVEEIGEWAFESCKGVKTSAIPASLRKIGDKAFQYSTISGDLDLQNVTELGKSAFYDCDGLQSITLGNELSTIPMSAFSNCDNLAFVTIPEGVETIEMYAFNNCTALERIELPAGLASIGQWAFANCSKLESLIFSASRTNIDSYAFAGCSALKDIIFTGDAPRFSEQAYADAFTDVVATAKYPVGGIGWDQAVLYHYGGDITWVPVDGICGDNLTWTLKDGTLTISGTGPMWDFDDENFDYYDETESPWYNYCEKITALVIEDGVTSVGSFAFVRCKFMETADIADSVTEFGNGAFKGCNALTAVTIPEEQKYIGFFTFSGCNSLTSVIIPNGVASIGEHAFAGSGLTSVVIPNSVSLIYDRAFDGCTELETVEIGSGVSTLCERAFGFCPRLSSVKFLGAPPNAGVNNVFAKSPSQNNTTLFAYYPGWMDSWTEQARDKISKDVVWKPYCMEHSWEEATCAAPMTCTVCGSTEGTATGNHVYPEGSNQCAVCGMFFYQVAFDGYKGDNFGGEFEINSSFSTRLFRQEECAAGAVIGDVLTFSISHDPLWDGMTFEGWLMYEEEGIEQGGPYYLQSGDLYTTAQVMQHTVPDYNVRYVAKWAEIPMSYYENLYDPYWGIGGGEETGIHVFACEVCSEASFTLLKDNEVLERNHHDYVVNLSQGETLGSRGYDFKDIVFWDPSRDFLGWNVCTFVEGYGYKQIEGTTTMTTEEMLAYTALDSVQLCFVGQWAGEDSEYYSQVAFDGFGGTYEVHFDGIFWNADDWEWRCREAASIGTENERQFGNNMRIENFYREGNDFLGWIEYTVVNGDYQMVSGNPIDTDTMLAKTVTENDMVFVARWSNVPWEDYENYAPGGGEGSETFNVWVSGGQYGRFFTMFNDVVWSGLSGTSWMYVPAGSTLRDEGYRFENWEFYPEYEGETHNRIGWYVGSWVDDNGNFEKLPGTGLLSDDEMLNYTIPAGTEIVFMAQWDEEADGGDVSTGGYVASITAAEEVTNGDRILALIKAKHSEETQFAAGEMVVRYDSSMLTFNKEASNLGNATVKDGNGILILEDYGEDKLFSNTAYVLAFDTKGTGTVTLNLESAAFVNKENAVRSDLIEATLDPASAVVVISRSQYPVTLDGIFNGPATATDGESYTFCAADTKHYVYDSVSVVMGGNSVGVTDNGDGSYTVERVNGPLTITGSRSERTFQVTFNGNGADKITDARPTATYGTEYVFDLPSEEGAVYTLTQILIDGQVYTDYMVTGKTITIDGMHIHGDMVITVTRTVTKATVTVEGNGAGAAAGYDPKLELGKDYTLTLNPAAGYSYTVTATMNGEPAEVIDNGDNTYTIKKVTGDIVFTVTRKVVTDAVTVSQYLKVNGANVWMVKFAAEVEPGKMPTYDGKPMYWSDEYDAYCYLVITEMLDEEEAKSKLDITDGTAPVLGDSMDVNGSGKIDASDAQLVYNMYNAMYGAFDDDVTMEKYFRADINKDGQINVQDAAAIIAKILA